MLKEKLFAWAVDPELVRPYASADDFTTARTLAESLNKHYPGHLWEIAIPPDQGVIHIFDQCMQYWGHSQGGRMGVVIKKTDYATSSELEVLAKRYCGQLLEQFNISRGRLKMDEFNALPTDFAGRHTFQA